MNLNNKGFAVSSIIYIILVIAVLLISMSLLNLSNIRLVLDKLSDEAYKNVYPDTNNIEVDLNGLTPVLYDGENWKIADTSKKWYDYDNQEWANAVVLNDDVVDVPGTPIYLDGDKKNIKAMFVYIPRYEYKIEGQYGKHTDGTLGTQSQPGEIKVKFIEKNEFNLNSGYIVHPAFWWDENNNGIEDKGEQLSGIWVGKFETSHETLFSNTIDDRNNLNCTEENCENGAGLRILPNVRPLTNNKVSNMFFASRAMSKENNDFGIIGNTHMMKNSEWGAVAYLSQSIYGKYGNSSYIGDNKEIYQNKSYPHITGSSNGTPSTSTYRDSQGGQTANENTTVQCKYNEDCGIGASTTGNITGIYDMSGGVLEYVMGVCKGDISETGFNILPEKKYYDLYLNYDMNSACNGTLCYGHALTETKNWYDDEYDRYGPIFESGRHWLQRGGFTGNQKAGIFYVIEDYGYANQSFGFRLVLIKLK